MPTQKLLANVVSTGGGSGSRMNYGNTAPENPKYGDRWFHSGLFRKYVYTLVDVENDRGAWIEHGFRIEEEPAEVQMMIMPMAMNDTYNLIDLPNDIAGSGSRRLHVVDGDNTVYLLGAQSGAAARSTDSGLTWSPLPNMLDPAVSDNETIYEFASIGNTVIAVAYDYVFRSTDAGATWSNITAPLTASGGNGSAMQAQVLGGYMFVFELSGYGAYSPDNGVNWYGFPRGYNTGHLSVGIDNVFEKGNDLYFFGSEGFCSVVRDWKSSDMTNIANFETITKGWPLASNVDTGAMRIFTTNGGSRYLAVGSKGVDYVAYSDDDMATWNTLDFNTFGISFPTFGNTHLAQDPNNDNNLIFPHSAGYDDSIFVSRDGGATWTLEYMIKTGYTGRDWDRAYITPDKVIMSYTGWLWGYIDKSTMLEAGVIPPLLPETPTDGQEVDLDFDGSSPAPGGGSGSHTFKYNASAGVWERAYKLPTPRKTHFVDALPAEPEDGDTYTDSGNLTSYRYLLPEGEQGCWVDVSSDIPKEPPPPVVVGDPLIRATSWGTAAGGIDIYYIASIGDVSLMAGKALGYRSTDGGVTWVEFPASSTPMGNDLWEDTRLFASADTFYASDRLNRGFYKSSDNGDTWVDITPPGSGDLGMIVVGQDNHIFTRTSSSDIYYSKDSGSNWLIVPEANGSEVCKSIGYGNGTLLMGYSQINDAPCYYSTDDGATWNQLPASLGVSNQLDGYAYHDFEYFNGYFYTSFGAGGAARSADGITWEAMSPFFDMGNQGESVSNSSSWVIEDLVGGNGYLAILFKNDKVMFYNPADESYTKGPEATVDCDHMAPVSTGWYAWDRNDPGLVSATVWSNSLTPKYGSNVTWFPASPSNGDKVFYSDREFEWDGEKWTGTGMTIFDDPNPAPEEPAAPAGYTVQTEDFTAVAGKYLVSNLSQNVVVSIDAASIAQGEIVEIVNDSSSTMQVHVDTTNYTIQGSKGSITGGDKLMLKGGAMIVLVAVSATKLFVADFQIGFNTP